MATLAWHISLSVKIVICLFKTKDIKTSYTLIAQLRFLPRVVNSRLFRVPWSVKIVVHFYLNSARESIKSSLMRPRRNYGKHYATNVAPTNASHCSLIFIIHKHFSRPHNTMVCEDSCIKPLSHAVYKLGWRSVYANVINRRQ